MLSVLTGGKQSSGLLNSAVNVNKACLSSLSVER